jgi:hypothetical protein
LYLLLLLFFINASDGVQMRSLFTITQKKNKKKQNLMNQKDNIVDGLRFCPFFFILNMFSRQLISIKKIGEETRPINKFWPKQRTSLETGVHLLDN